MCLALVAGQTQYSVGLCWRGHCVSPDHDQNENDENGDKDDDENEEDDRL